MVEVSEEDESLSQRKETRRATSREAQMCLFSSQEERPESAVAKRA